MRYIFLIAVATALSGCACVPDSMQPKTLLHHRTAIAKPASAAPVTTISVPIHVDAAPTATAPQMKTARKRLRDLFIKNHTAQ